MRSILETNRDCIEHASDELLWWTFAGGRINATLRYALEVIAGDWKVIPDNYCIKFRGENVSLGRVRSAIAVLRSADFWENEKIWKDIAASLPSYRLSKFQILMPSWIEREIVAKYLLDVNGAQRWLSCESAHPQT